MISERLERNREINEICKNCGDILPDAEFNGAVIAKDDGDECSCLPQHAQVICCGRMDRDGLLFRTADGRYYFSVRQGWGERNGILYGMELGFVYDFGHATNAASIGEECRNQRGTYHSWSGAMAYHRRNHIFDTICQVMKKQ